MSYIWTVNLFFKVRYLKLSFSDSRFRLSVCLSWQPLSVWSDCHWGRRQKWVTGHRRAPARVPAPGSCGRGGRVRLCDSAFRAAAARQVTRKEAAGRVATPGRPQPAAGEPLPSAGRRTQTGLQASCWAVSEFRVSGSEPGGAGLPALPWGRSVHTEKATSRPSGAPVLLPAGGARRTVSPWVWVVPLPVRMSGLWEV